MAMPKRRKTAARRLQNAQSQLASARARAKTSAKRMRAWLSQFVEITQDGAPTIRDCYLYTVEGDKILRSDWINTPPKDRPQMRQIKINGQIVDINKTDSKGMVRVLVQYGEHKYGDAMMAYNLRRLEPLPGIEGEYHIQFKRYYK